MIYPIIIEYKSKEYGEMLALRHRILHEPLDLTFSEQDLLQDADDILLGISVSSVDALAACCILSPQSEQIVKLRQMAVAENVQNSGLGTSMLAFAEYVAEKRDFETIVLHARKTAVGFYEKYDYKIIGNEFTEVGIPHYKMEKKID